MESPVITEVRSLVPHLWKSTLLSGLLSIVMGVLMLVWPTKTLAVAGVLFGAYLLISGIAQVFFAFTLHVSAGGRVLLFLSGAASLILAVLAFRHFGEGYAVLLLAIWIAVGFIFRGVAHTVSAISDPGLPGRGWEIFFGIISLIAGIVMLAWPGLSLLTLLMVVGWYLIFIGVFEVVMSFAIRRETKALTS
ncbi:MAG TPA: HdeD family acid-resistance protein [Mycobacterium sp.]|nr:HdeD family acid-resistance protein [Mycobacterium sp.]